MTIITITAGHSDTDPGAIAADGTTEAQICEDMRNAVRLRLERMGYSVRSDGAGLVNLPLGEAIKMIAGSAVAVELHCNAADSQQATGVEVVALPRDKYRAQAIAGVVADCLSQRLRGEKGWIDQSQTHRGKLGFVNAGGLIVEMFFLSNPKDLKTYHERRDTLADGIAQAIDHIVRIGGGEP